MEKLEGFRFVNAEGKLLPVTLEVLRPLKGIHDIEKPAFQVRDGPRQWLMKVRPYRNWRGRWRATLGRSRLKREIGNIALARAAGFPVPQIAGYGHRHRWGMVAADALLVEWIEGCEPLRQQIEQAVQAGRVDQVLTCRAIVLDFLARVRSAGLADKDFGVHNILIQPAQASAGDSHRRSPVGSPAPPPQVVWVDLERVFSSDPTDPFGTGSTLGSFLASWWLATRMDEGSFHDCFREACCRLTPPRGGWEAVMPLINQTVAGKLGPHLRFQFIDRPAPVLMAPLAAAAR